MQFDSLEQWRAWQQSRRSVTARLRDRLRGGRPPELWLATSGTKPQVLLALDSLNSSSRIALLPVAERLYENVEIAYVVPKNVIPGLPRHDELQLRPLGETKSNLTAKVQATLTSGDHMPAGAAAYELGRDTPFFVVQHGMLTPYAPPLSARSHLLAWTDADARMWTDRRPDTAATTVGSQMLFEAARQPTATVDDGRPAVFLGQLHGAELDREVTIRTVDRLGSSIVYRPHPAERDWRSRLQHGRWKRRGIPVDVRNTPLPQLGRPVVGIFSTGILEAAAAGVPAWGACVDPPPWVPELWERYAIARWGDDAPTPRPPLPAEEPARAIARIVAAKLS